MLVLEINTVVYVYTHVHVCAQAAKHSQKPQQHGCYKNWDSVTVDLFAGTNPLAYSFGFSDNSADLFLVMAP